MPPQRGAAGGSGSAGGDDADSAALVATREHCLFCFETLAAHLQGRPLPEPEFDDAHCALFVTWNKHSSSSGGAPSPPRLRGCIGTLEPRRLRPALRDYALTSALRDSRFSPIAARELASLSCGVSLLRAFERAGSWDDWDVGRHGLIIEFNDPRLGCRRSATFLPEVAAEQRWGKAATLEALVRKAGYDGPLTPELRDSLKVTRYQSSKAAASYADYAAAIAAAAAATATATATAAAATAKTCRADAAAEEAGGGEGAAAAASAVEEEATVLA